MLINFKSLNARLQLHIDTNDDVKEFFANWERSHVMEQEGAQAAISPTTVAEAKGLLAYFLELSNAHEEIPRILQEYLAESFKKIIEDDSGNKEWPSKALGLHITKRGRPRIHEERDENICKELEALRAGGLSLFDAALEIAEKYGRHESHIQKIYCAALKDRGIPF